MKKTKQTADTDITEQRYRGPSPFVAGAGESVLHGKFLLISGVLVGALAGAIFPAKTAEFTTKGREYLAKWKGSENHFVHGAGSLFDWLLGAGQGLVNWLRGFKSVEGGIAKLEKNDPYKRVATALDGAVVTSAVLSLVGFFTGIFTGARTSNRGKKQFETAKEEIITLRDTNEKLRTKLIDTELELDDLKTAANAKHGTLHVAKSDPAPRPQIEADSVSHSRVADLTSDVALG